MRRLRFNLFFILFVLTALPTVVWAGCGVGEKAPDFTVFSGEDKTVALADVSGKVAVIFYEHKDTATQTIPIKDQVDAFVAAHPQGQAGNVVRVTIIDGTSANAFTKGIYKSRLKKKSEEYGKTLYADWDGSMKAAYEMADKGNNIVVVDKAGQVIYCRQGGGESVPAEEIIQAIQKAAE